MNPEASLGEVQAKLVGWAGQTTRWIGDVFDLFSTCPPREKPLDPRFMQVLWQLNASCHSTTESALLLIANVRLWDAEVLVRSFVEGTFKFIYLTLGSEDVRMQKLQQFDSELGRVGLLKRHQRLTAFLEAVDDPQSNDWHPFREMLLTDQDYKLLQEQFPKRVRQQLDQQWSFGGLCSAIANAPGKEYGMLRHMMFNYGMGSHIAHQDIDGIGIIADRINRNQIRREAVELAHGARMAGEAAIFTWVRAHAFLRLMNAQMQTLAELCERRKSLEEEFDTAQGRFHDVEYASSGEAIP